MLRPQQQNRRLVFNRWQTRQEFRLEKFCARRLKIPGVARLKLLCVKLKPAAARRARLSERGTSGSVQRGPANPARPGREQRYRDCLGCRRSPEVPRAETQFAVGSESRKLAAPRRALRAYS